MYICIYEIKKNYYKCFPSIFLLKTPANNADKLKLHYYRILMPYIFYINTGINTKITLCALTAFVYKIAGGLAMFVNQTLLI